MTLREQIARIIDPDAWASNDFSLAAAGVKSAHHDRRAAPSLAKADEILALVTPPSPTPSKRE